MDGKSGRRQLSLKSRWQSSGLLLKKAKGEPNP